MSRKTKRKHVFKEVLEDDLSVPSENQTIVKILSTKGNNLHEVLAPDQSTYLVSMPTKFRKNVWVKRGNYVLVEPIEEGDKVKGEIVRILTNEHIKSFKEDKVWPSEFDDQDKNIDNKTSDCCSDADDLFQNTNRLHLVESSDECSNDSEHETEEDSDENNSLNKS